MSGREKARRWCAAQARKRGGHVWTSEETGRHYWGRTFAEAWPRAVAADLRVQRRGGPPMPPTDTLTRGAP